MASLEFSGTGERDGRCCRPVAVPRPNFYRDALDAKHRALLDAAAAVPGLDEEVALLRVLLHRALAEHPENLRPVFQGLTQLVRLLLARSRVAVVPDEAIRLEGLARSLEDVLFRDENAPGGEEG